MTHPAIERFHQAQEYAGNPALRSVMEAVKCTDEGNMKLILKVDDLRDALARAIKVVGTFIPILSHVLLVTHHNALLFTAADIQTGLSVSIPAEVQCSGAYTVSAPLLLECVKALPKGALLTIEVKESRLVLTCATHTFSLKDGGPACRYPQLWRAFNFDTACVVGSDVLCQGIKEVLFPTMKMVCLHILGDLVELVATDGQCLARRTMKLEGVQAGVQTTIQVPVPSMRSLSQMMSNEGKVVMAWDKQRIIFQSGRIQMAARLVEWTLPDHMHLLSTADTSTVFTLERWDLEQMVKSSKPFSKMFTLSYHQGSVTLQAGTEKLGEVSLSVAPPMFGKSGQIILHRQHLTDILKKVMAKTFTFCILDFSRRAIVVPDGREDCLFVLASFLANE